MKKLLSLLFLSSFLLRAQDTSKIMQQEIGLNSISFIKQFINNSAAATVPQLPYDFFYNIYYKDRIGLRLGAGVRLLNTETQIQGQSIPRTTNTSQANFRAGFSHNFRHYKRITLNAFADYVFAKSETETATTVTAQAFPDPIQTITTETSDVTRAEGWQTGFGIKCNIYKHLCLYAEAPITILIQKNTSEVSINDSGELSGSSTIIRTTSIQFYVPTTLYIVLKF